MSAPDTADGAKPMEGDLERTRSEAGDVEAVASADSEETLASEAENAASHDAEDGGSDRSEEDGPPQSDDATSVETEDDAPDEADEPAESRRRGPAPVAPRRSNLSREEVRSVLEAVLFASPKPATSKELRDAVGGVSAVEVEEILLELEEEYRRDKRGIRLVEVGGGYQLVSNPEHAGYVQRLARRRRGRLSQAALETLAVIAYEQPVTKARIEEIRGVNVDGVLNTLLERGLVSISGRAQAPGRPLLFVSTPEFLNYFGLRSLRDLPHQSELQGGAGEAD
jgi:segregation and condensation protein B